MQVQIPRRTLCWRVNRTELNWTWNTHTGVGTTYHNHVASVLFLCCVQHFDSCWQTTEQFLLHCTVGRVPHLSYQALAIFYDHSTTIVDERIRIVQNEVLRCTNHVMTVDWMFSSEGLTFAVVALMAMRAYSVIFTSTLLGVLSIAITVHVCLPAGLFVHSHTSKTTCPNFTKFSAHNLYGHSSVLLWQQCSTLYFGAGVA